MDSSHSFAFIGILLALAGVGCDHSPEGFCEQVVEETCEALKGCCESGQSYDGAQCRVLLSRQCGRAVRVEAVHAGKAVFDYGAARDCLADSLPCRGVQDSTVSPNERLAACFNMLTGFQPPGAACDSADECEKSGDFSMCYGGWSGGGRKVCASVVLDESVCGFSLETSELKFCAEGKTCDMRDIKPNLEHSPTAQAMEFTAKCLTGIDKGGSCFSDKGLLPCADGLFCEQVGSSKATCESSGGVGTSCTSAEECASGLVCGGSGGPGKCLLADGLFCFEPARCGDGKCAPSEHASSCPEDCSSEDLGATGDGCADDAACKSGVCNEVHQCL